MKKGMKILVAYDGSEYADRALSEAIDIAKWSSGSLVVLTVSDKSEDEAKLIARDSEKRLKKADVKYELRSLFYPNIPDSITHHAREEACNLIAIGTRGTGRTRAWLIGSVATRVIAEAPCPVLVTTATGKV